MELNPLPDPALLGLNMVGHNREKGVIFDLGKIHKKESKQVK